MRPASLTRATLVAALCLGMGNVGTPASDGFIAVTHDMVMDDDAVSSLFTGSGTPLSEPAEDVTVSENPAGGTGTVADGTHEWDYSPVPDDWVGQSPPSEPVPREPVPREPGPNVTPPSDDAPSLSSHDPDTRETGRNDPETALTDEPHQSLNDENSALPKGGDIGAVTSGTDSTESDTAGPGGIGTASTESDSAGPDSGAPGTYWLDPYAPLWEQFAATDISTDSNAPGQHAPGIQAFSAAVNRSNRAAVAHAFNEIYQPNLVVRPQWLNGNASTCQPGTVDAAGRSATHTVTNFYRAMAGSAPVRETAQAALHAQQRALMVQANRTIMHMPAGGWPETWQCRHFGYPFGVGAGLAWGATGPAAVRLWTQNPGHREALLNSRHADLGFGSTTNAAAFGGVDATAVPFSHTRDFAWPNGGYFPYELSTSRGTQAELWSFTRPREFRAGSANPLVGAQVTVTRNGQPFAITGVTPALTPDMSTLRWTMPNLPSPPAGGADLYRVRITGIPNPVDYTVRLFHATGVNPPYQPQPQQPHQPSVHMPAPPTERATKSGTARVGHVLTANPAGTGVSFQWLRNGSPIPGATGRTRRLDAADYGQRLRVRASRVRNGVPEFIEPSNEIRVGSGTITTNAASKAGTRRVGQVLTANRGTWSTPLGNATVRYQWLRNGRTIPGATNRTYRAVPADRGQRLSVRVTGTRAGFATATRTSSAVTINAGMITGGRVAVTGTVAVGGTVRANTSAFASAPRGTHQFSFQWQRNGRNIRGATSRTYRLREADRNQRITVRVTARRTGYTQRTVTSGGIRPNAIWGGNARITGLPASGTPAVGTTLTARAGGFTGRPQNFTVQWLRNGRPIPGATRSTYRLTRADRGAQISVRVRATRPGFRARTITSPRTHPVR